MIVVRQLNQVAPVQHQQPVPSSEPVPATVDELTSGCTRWLEKVQQTTRALTSVEVGQIVEYVAKTEKKLVELYRQSKGALDVTQPLKDLQQAEQVYRQLQADVANQELQRRIYQANTAAAARQIIQQGVQNASQALQPFLTPSGPGGFGAAGGGLGFPPMGMPQPGFGQVGYPPTGYPQSGFGAGYPQPGHPQPGYPQTGYSPVGYPQPGYPSPVSPTGPGAGYPFAAYPQRYYN